MKKKLTMLLICAMPYIASAQSVKYSYDNAGNRIKREIVMKTKAPYEEVSTTTEYFSEKLSEKDIRIYPNPTKGRLKIEIVGYENSDRCTLRILNVSGQQILSAHANSPCTELDISSKANGVYILYISLNNKETAWKIIKTN